MLCSKPPVWYRVVRLCRIETLSVAAKSENAELRTGTDAALMSFGKIDRSAEPPSAAGVMHMALEYGADSAQSVCQYLGLKRLMSPSPIQTDLELRVIGAKVHLYRSLG